jgi:hypothetical protein
VYLGPILDAQGQFELRVFVVCFDSGAVFIYDPVALETYGTNATPEGVIYTGSRTGPFAMTFDPLPLECVAVGDPSSPLWKANPLLPNSPPCPTAYRFGYIANFTQSFVQMIDLDNDLASNPYAPYTFEQGVVFTLGNPTLPKGQ